MVQCIAKYNGLDVQVSASMTRSPGVTPDVGSLTWRSNGTQPSTATGTLEIYNDVTLIDRWSDCLLDDPKERRGRYIDFVYRVKDRRWRWEYPVLFGAYNVRDKNEEIIPGTERTVRQLAELALNELGETGYDVSALPNIDGPEVYWHYTPAATFLDSLCSMHGCQVHLGANTETVTIHQMGIGSIPDSVGLMKTPEVGVILNPAPENITAYAGDTLFESWLELEAVGFELDGTAVLVNDLSYKPAIGWVMIPTTGNLVTATMEFELIDGGATREEAQKMVSLAKRHVFRTYRVKGLAGGVGPPGVTGVTIDDPRQLFPLEPTRITWGDDLSGEKKRLEMEVMGKFLNLDNQGRELHGSGFSLWRAGASLNTTEGYVSLGAAAYQQVSNGCDPAELYLRTGYRLRLAPYQNIYHRQVTIPTGSGTGTANGIVKRDDIHEVQIAQYANQYDDDFSHASVFSNTTTVDTFLTEAANENLKQYQNLQAPQKRQYTPVRTVNTDGIVQQVQHTCGVGQFGVTTVSIAAQYDGSQPPAYIKRLRDQQRKKAKEDLQNFTVDKPPVIESGYLL